MIGYLTVPEQKAVARVCSGWAVSVAAFGVEVEVAEDDTAAKQRVPMKKTKKTFSPEAQVIAALLGKEAWDQKAHSDTKKWLTEVFWGHSDAQLLSYLPKLADRVLGTQAAKSWVTWSNPTINTLFGSALPSACVYTGIFTSLNEHAVLQRVPRARLEMTCVDAERHVMSLAVASCRDAMSWLRGKLSDLGPFAFPPFLPAPSLTSLLTRVASWEHSFGAALQQVCLPKPLFPSSLPFTFRLSCSPWDLECTYSCFSGGSLHC